MEIPSNVFKRQKRSKRIEVPENIISDNLEDIPNNLLVKYKDTIDVEFIDKIIIHKLKVLQNLNENVDHYDKYLLESQDLISKYKKTNSIKVAQEYVNLANEYITIDCVKIKEKIVKCDGCGEVIDEKHIENEDTFVCSFCNCINTFLSPRNFTKQNEKNISDDDTTNFIKLLDKFEGKGEYIPEEVYTELDKLSSSINMEKGEYYRKLPLLPNGKKEGTSKKKIIELLELSKNGKYYDETNAICHEYWGWKLPDISDIRQQLISDYRRTQEVWADIKQNYNRSASLGTQFRLFVQLKALDYPCEREDFKIQDMVDSLRFHNDAWEIMCKRAGVKYTFVI